MKPTAYLATDPAGHPGAAARFQFPKGSIGIEAPLLNNDESQDFGTMAVVLVDPMAQGKEGKAPQTNLDKQSPAPSREPPRPPDAAPKSVPPLQQQAPGKSTGPVFQR